LGIANTLALSVFERTRELGLLRAIGMARRQVRAMVRWESVIIALFGTCLGLVIGLFFSWAMVTAVPDQAALTVPVGQLAAGTVVAAIAGVVAAIGPARRAARLDVLAAIATE
jgi:putative ABC transport system permease protein